MTSTICQTGPTGALMSFNTANFFVLRLHRRLQLLEDVLGRYTILVKGLQDIQYEERAPLLNLDSLPCRMDKGDIGQ